MMTGESYTARYFNHQGYSVLYLSQIRNMDVRIRLIPMRENPPTITANKECAGKPVAHFSRTHVASIPEKVSDGGTRKPGRGNVDYRIPGIPDSTDQKEDTNRKETQDCFSSSRITRTGTRCCRT